MPRQRPGYTIWTRDANTHVVRIELLPDPVSGKRRRKTETVRGPIREAKSLGRQLVSQRDTGVELSPDKITVTNWLERWLKRHYAEGNIVESVFDRYDIVLKKHLIPSIGHISLTELRSDQIADLKGRWLSGESSTASKPLGPATVRKHLHVLRTALSDAVKSKLLAYNPADAVPLPSIKHVGEQRALDQGEISELLSSATGNRLDVPIRFTLSTGLRQGELLALRWSDIDMDRGLIHCRGTKTKHSKRTIEVSQGIVGLLRHHRSTQLEQRLRKARYWEELDLVFPSTIGKQWLGRLFYREYKTVVNRSALKDNSSVTWHTLRHTAASQWILHDVDIFTVSRRLGHASATFTMDVYGHLLKGQQAAAATALDYMIVN
jgi:integrase